MSDRDNFPETQTEEEFEGRHDPELVERILLAIEDYNRDKGAVPSPTPLRDTMLAVAALLHLDAVLAGGLQSAPFNTESVGEAFAEAACEQLQAVIEVKGAIVPKQ